MHYTEAMQTLFPSFQAFLQTFSINMKEICKRYLTTAPLYGIIPMMRDLRNKEMYIALDDYKEMYAESCMKRGESLSVNGLKEFIALYQVRIKKSSVSVEAATETDGNGWINGYGKQRCMHE